MAGEWLTGTVVKETIGDALSTDVDTAALEVHATAVRSYIEDRRADLFLLDVGADPEDPEDDVLVFTPPAHVVTAAARLAYACYQSTSDPDAVLADDVAAMLGIRKHRGFRFGGAALVVVP